jgi:hypothetical protein
VTPTTITPSGDYWSANEHGEWTASGVLCCLEEVSGMLEWKPKLVALLVLLVALAVLLGQLSWVLFDSQLSW